MKGRNSLVVASMSPISITSYLLLLFVLNFHEPQSKWAVKAQLEVTPDNYDGFVYGKPMEYNPNRILIEAFFDVACSDSRASWPPLKQALHYYDSQVSLTVHLIPLPYHDNAFVLARALHVVNELNRSATYPMMEKFFNYQDKIYNETSDMSRSEIVDHIADYVVDLLGHKYYSAVKRGFSDTKTDLKTRISQKYASTRGVIGVPTFAINGFALPNSTVDYKGWRKIIDSIIRSKRDDTTSL